MVGREIFFSITQGAMVKLFGDTKMAAFAQRSAEKGGLGLDVKLPAPKRRDAQSRRGRESSMLGRCLFIAVPSSRQWLDHTTV
jgi:hypothetical protein